MADAGLARRALRRVNEIREARGSPPLHDLPRGTPECPAECPVALGLETPPLVGVDYGTLYAAPAGDSGDTSPEALEFLALCSRVWGTELPDPQLAILPPDLITFVREFDYCELEDESPLREYLPEGEAA